MAQISNTCIYQIFFIFFVAVHLNFAASNDTSLILNNKTLKISSTNITAEKINNKTTSNDTTHRGREGLSTSKSSKVLHLPKSTDDLKSKAQLIATSKNVTLTTPLNSTSSVSPNPLKAATNSVSKTISNTPKATSSIATTARPKKPLMTEHDYVDLPIGKPEIFTPSIVHIDASMEQKVRRADYIVPIVAVILSVPLVAIIISVLYKRGKDWWQHRNYRRMDYLIEGMYNS